jgi:hypothetical protein
MILRPSLPSGNGLAYSLLICLHPVIITKCRGITHTLFWPNVREFFLVLEIDSRGDRGSLESVVLREIWPPE